MAFDRSKYKAASLNTVQKTVKETKKYDTYYGSGKTEFAPFWQNKDGIVVKRVLPAHEPGDSPYVPMMTALLNCEVDKKNEKGEVTGKEVKLKKVFIGTLHGGLPYDIIEEYIKRVYEQAEQIQDAEDRRKFLNPITGYRMGKGGKWVWGIRPSLEYVYYAYIEGKIYRDSLRPKQMEALNKESADLCEQNDTVAVDMFSDPTNGFPIQWSRSKDDKGKTVETIKSLPLKMGQSWEEYFEQNAVPDKVLEELEAFPPLKKIYVNSYSRKDFELALDGLKRFDEANSYKIFAQDDYLDLVEEMDALVSKLNNDDNISEEDDELPFEEETTEEAPKKTIAPKRAAVVKKKNEPTDEEKLAVVNKEFIRQYGDGYEPLELAGEELDNAYKLALNHEDLNYDAPHIEGWDSVDDDTPEPEPEAAPAPIPQPKKAEAKGVVSPKDANSRSGMSALQRIQEKRRQQQQQR